MNKRNLCRNSLTGLGLAVGLLLMSGCSTTGETPDPADPTYGGGENCSQYPNLADIRKCEIRNDMRN